MFLYKVPSYGQAVNLTGALQGGRRRWSVLSWLGAFRSCRPACRPAAAELADWQTGSIRCRNAAGKAKALTLNSSPSPSSIRPSQAPKSYLPSLNRPSHLAASHIHRAIQVDLVLILSFLESIYLSFTTPQPSRCLQISGKQASADSPSKLRRHPWELQSPTPPSSPSHKHLHTKLICLLKLTMMPSQPRLCGQSFSLDGYLSASVVVILASSTRLQTTHPSGHHRDEMLTDI